LKTSNHSADHVAALDELRRFGVAQVLSAVGGDEASSDLSVGSRSDSQKMHELIVVASQKSLTDVVNHRQRRSVQLAPQIGVISKFPPVSQFSNLIALTRSLLPYAKIFESADTHAPRRRMHCASEAETKDGPRPKDHGPRTKD